ncbi:MAG: alpha/beta fold hydrolase [Rhodospirillales bacterium]|nr:alpha/beta fold hydrolase [Rhodospirillales bacterium]
MSQDIYFETIGQDGPAVFWGHGWGQNLHAFMPLAESLAAMGRHWLVDFPGFGKSPAPESVWSTEDYADAVAALIRAQTDRPVLWIGHSFGCRVGLQLAARHPELIAGLVLVAGAGLPRKRPLWHKLYYGARVKLFKFLKKLVPLGLSQEWLYRKFGSADYRNAGPLREILVKVVNEDLSAVAAQIKCPTLLIYGSKDRETPPEIGERLSRIIPGSELILMDGFDHYSILSEARHRVVHRIHSFIKETFKP